MLNGGYNKKEKTNFQRLKLLTENWMNGNKMCMHNMLNDNNNDNDENNE